VVVDRQRKRINRGSGSAVVAKKGEYVNTRGKRTTCSDIVHKKRATANYRNNDKHAYNIVALSGIFQTSKQEQLEFKEL
jgi:hypothetical protein